MPQPRLTFLSAVLLAGCATTAPVSRTGSAPAPAPVPAAEGTPRTIREALARELTAPLPLKPVKAEGIDFEGSVPSAGTPEVVKHPNGTILLTLPIGTGVPISCIFYPQPVDAGAAVQSLFGSLLADFTLQSARTTHVKALADSPAIYLDADFTRGTGAEQKVGRIKVMAHADPVLPKACFHDELGYTQAFLDVTEAVATGLTSTAAEKPVPPYYSDVQVMRAGDVPFGFQYSALFGSKTGGSILEVSTSMVRPGPAAQLQFVDTNLVEQADPAGVLVAKSYAKRENTTVVASMRLSRQEDGSYGVEGQVGGKDVKATLKGEIIGQVGLAARLREGLLKGQGNALEALMWVAPVNPATPTKVVVRPRAEAGVRAVTMEVGPMSTKMELDPHGFPLKTEVPAGNVAFNQERISQTGEP
jgi:hypothetical protein